MPALTDCFLAEAQKPIRVVNALSKLWKSEDRPWTLVDTVWRSDGEMPK